ncbi:hypothetical protein U1Q18_048402, partial [Sarracenia purpurea var. burkii]
IYVWITSSDGEEAVAGSIHKNEFALIASVWFVQINSEDELALRVVDGEAIPDEEERGFVKVELDL